MRIRVANRFRLTGSIIKPYMVTDLVLSRIIKLVLLPASSIKPLRISLNTAFRQFYTCAPICPRCYPDAIPCLVISTSISGIKHQALKLSILVLCTAFFKAVKTPLIWSKQTLEVSGLDVR